MAIRKLPLLLINQIAAGEVIERPASVVKELVENSLDAGARRIDIAIEDGGRELIRVSDDGSGIPADELALAVVPHATSKLAKPEDLAAIATLGFRGEALASIASVSRLRLTSRPRVDGQLAEAGACIEASGDHVEPVRPAGCASGTVVQVRDLFFNTPARRKFLRAASAEFGQIDEIVSRIAMVRPDVAFTLTHNDRKVIEAPATASRKERCVALLGKELDPALLEFEFVDPRPAESGQVAKWPSGQVEEEESSADNDSATGPLGHSVTSPSVWGLAGLPSIARATSKFQYLCVNGRPIRDRSLGHAIKEAYRGLIPPDRQPLAVVFIDMPSGELDVNVHPAKTEVRFRNPNAMHGLVLTALRQRLLGSDLTPSAAFADAQPRMETMSGSRMGGGGYSSAGSSVPAAVPSVAGFVDYFKRMAPNQKGFAYQEVKRALEQEDPAAAAPSPPLIAGNPPIPVPAAPDTAAAVNSAQSTPSDPATYLVPPILQAHGVLQVHKSYLVTQDEQGILIVDQHALHERVMFEELRQRLLVSGGHLESQRLLMPVILSVSPRRMALIEQLAPLLEKLGIEAQPMGPASVGIHAFPSFLFDRRVEPDAFFQDLLDEAEEDRFDQPGTHTEESILHQVLDMMACKAAVKAGDHLSPQELAALLVQREQIERGSSCPHGRPTTIRLTLRELEKQFKRT